MKKTLKYRSMDDTNIRHYLPNAKIFTYIDLSDIINIEELLPKHKSFLILLYPVKSETDGHWVCLTRYDKTVEYFDSYGHKPDEPLKWGKFKDIPHYLSNLLNKTKLRVTYNNIDFQNKRDYNIATCGAYAVFRVLTMIENQKNGKDDQKEARIKSSHSYCLFIYSTTISSNDLSGCVSFNVFNIILFLSNVAFISIIVRTLKTAKAPHVAILSSRLF